MGTPADRLRRARIDAGYRTATDAARAFGVSRDTYLQHENGTRTYDDDAAKLYARRLNVTPEHLKFGTEFDARPRMVKVVGYVGAGDAAHYYDTAQGPFEEVLAPPEASERTVAARIRGTSVGRHFDNWLVFYDDVRFPVTPDLHGELCVVGLPDGRVLVKWLRGSRVPGVYHLESETEPTMLDQEVTWAAKVTSLRPR